MKKFFMSAILAVTMLFVAGCDQNSGFEPLKDTEYKHISGIVADVQYIAEGTSFNAPDIRKTVVRFEDGRVKAFNEITEETIQIGRTNVFSYNKSGQIVSVEIE